MPSIEVDTFRAIADPTRRRILDLLLEGEKPVQAVADHLPITLGATSQHLQILLRSGLVTRTKQGRQRIYRLQARRLREVDEWMSRYRSFWNTRLDRLGQVLDEKNRTT